MELTNIDLLIMYDTYSLRQLCKENNIGKKYKGIPVYKLKKAEMIEFLKGNMPLIKLTREEMDYIVVDKCELEMTSVELIYHLKNKVKDLQLINIRKQREMNELTLDLEDAIIERDHLKKEINEYIKEKLQPPPPLDKNNVNDDLKCPVCLEYKVNTVLSCTHVLCNSCEKKLSSCPICREEIKKFMVSYFRM